MNFISKALGTACVYTVLLASLTLIREWNETSWLYSCKALPHFGRYSFPVPQRVGDWVGLDQIT